MHRWGSPPLRLTTRDRYWSYPGTAPARACGFGVRQNAAYEYSGCDAIVI
jgi:hypothetical protein